MAINSTHPDYDAHLEDWLMLRDAYEGERRVKSKGTTYLPATPAQVLDGMDAGKPGRIAYESYLKRAKFPDYVADAVEHYVGLLHQKEAEIELPDGMAGMLERATPSGESLQDLLRRINEQQLSVGRLGLMLDWPISGDSASLPYIALYYTEAARNWDESDDGEGFNALQLVVLDETGPVREENLEWVTRERYRVLVLDVPYVPEAPVSEATLAQGAEPGVQDATERQDAAVVYQQGVFNTQDSGQNLDRSQLIVPMYRGRALEQIPFVFINSKDIVATPDKPPLLGLGRASMTIYRAEADYRHTLFMQGQDTFVTIGTVTQNGEHVTGDDALRVGAGAHVALDAGGDAKYVGVGADGLAEQRTSLENDRKAAESRAGTLISPSAGRQESGEALHTRIAAQTTNLTQVAKSGAAGLQAILRIAAQWMGLDPQKVVVTPNTDFAPVVLSGQETAQLMGAKAMGLPLSRRSIHGVLRDRGLTQFDYDTELQHIADEDGEEAKRQAQLNVSLGLNPDGSSPQGDDPDDAAPGGRRAPPGGPQGSE